MSRLAVFSGSASINFAQSVCQSIQGMQVSLCKSRCNKFPDTEVIVKVEEDVRGKDCFIIQSTSSPANETLMELLIYIDCLKRASAKSITAVIPYFGYARQDRKDRGRTPITAKLVANLLTEAGANRILTLDLHALQIEGFFDIPVDHLRAAPVFIKKLRQIDLTNAIILSPDSGNAKEAEIYANGLGLDLAIIHKKRINGEEVDCQHIMGDVKDKDVLMFDDMISTAGTICEASKLAKKKGAKSIKVFATHGLFVGKAVENIKDSAIDEITITDTVRCSDQLAVLIGRAYRKPKNKPIINILSVAPLVGEAISRIYRNKSVSVLLEL